MIVDLVKFINGDIYEVNRTKSKIILSNDHAYNDRLFHQNLSIVRQCLNYLRNKTVDETPEIKELNIQIEKYTTALETARRDALKQLQSLRGRDLIANLPYVLPYGKYEGRPLNEVLKVDPSYVEWFVTKANSLKSVFRSYEIQCKQITPIAKININEPSKPLQDDSKQVPPIVP